MRKRTHRSATHHGHQRARYQRQSATCLPRKKCYPVGLGTKEERWDGELPVRSPSLLRCDSIIVAETLNDRKKIRVTLTIYAAILCMLCGFL